MESSAVAVEGASISDSRIELAESLPLETPTLSCGGRKRLRKSQPVGRFQEKSFEHLQCPCSENPIDHAVIADQCDLAFSILFQWPYRKTARGDQRVMSVEGTELP